MSDLDFDNNLQKVITVIERKRLKLELQELEESLSAPKNNKTNWLLVASVALLVSLGSYFLLFNNKVSSKELYAQNFRPYPNVVESIVRGDENSDKKTIAFTYYEQKQYNEAFKLFDELVSKNLMDKNTLNFYMANALLELNNPVKAISLFLPLAEKESEKWQSESLWYLALAYLKIEEVENAKKYLNRLQNTSNFKAKQVAELLADLK